MRRKHGQHIVHFLTALRSYSHGAICCCFCRGARGKLVVDAENFGNRQTTTSEKCFPLCGQKLTEAFAEALAESVFQFWTDNAIDLESLSQKRSGSTLDLDQIVCGRACGGTAPGNLPVLSTQ